MFKMQKAGLGLAAVLGIMIATPVSADEACQRALATINRAQATLTQIAQLIDGIKARQQSAENVNVDQPLKCPACGMMMPTHPTGSLTRAVKYNGKTYYCCAGCDMSATADKE